MPITVITVTNAPPSLRGDLTRWMQEIATGVYVGNFNSRIREELWKRVVDRIGNGQATITYAHQNEIGYNFETKNTESIVIDYDGVPLVLIPNKNQIKEKNNTGYSKAAKFHKSKVFSGVKPQKKRTYVILDIETDGLDVQKNNIIEIAAVKISYDKVKKFHSFITYKSKLPEDIIKLTGINERMLQQEGRPIEDVLKELVEFIGSYEIAGYGLNFDIRFLNKALKKASLPIIRNKSCDLINLVKKEKKFLDNYKLKTVLKAYGIEGEVPHRALEDAELITKLSFKVKGFINKLENK